jgi:hypothetical protein
MRLGLGGHRGAGLLSLHLLQASLKSQSLNLCVQLLDLTFNLETLQRYECRFELFKVHESVVRRTLKEDLLDLLALALELKVLAERIELSFIHLHDS